MKVLFSNSYFYKLDPKQWRSRQPYPPLGTLLAAAVVRDMSHEVYLFDSNLKDSPMDIVSTLEKIQPEILVIYEDGFNYLTKMCLAVMREAAFVLIGEGKKLGCKVVIASSDSSDHYSEYLGRGADVVIQGEGEETLRALLAAMEHGASLDSILGIAFRRGEEVIITSQRPVIRDLDALPFPAWDLVEMDAYKNVWISNHGYFSLNLATTRGCPFKCNWCAKPIYGNRYNSRSPESVTAEIAYLIEHFQPDHFWMCDDIFGLKPGWVVHFREEVRKRNLRFRFKIQSRVDLLLEPDAIASLREAGAETVWLGAESGSQKILDAMDKGTTVRQIIEATQLLKTHGIKVAYFLQFGYPGELASDIEATLQLVLREMPDEIGISVSYPLPRTKFYENVKAQLGAKKNWTDSDDLALMFRNVYPTSYYKILQRYVHNRYRIQRGLIRLKQFIRHPGFHSGDFRKISSMLFHIPITLIQLYQLKRLSHSHV
jgi:radical SAM superfamily enzyme YgiQ (UPF0313 family)